MTPKLIHVHVDPAPSHWAPYLINGDHSGLSDKDIEQCNEWRKEIPGHVVDCRDPYIGRWNQETCELCEYVFCVNGE